MSIRFGLKAERKFDGKFCVLPWFEFVAAEREAGGPANVAAGFIDAGTMAAYPKEYEAFKSYIETHAEVLYPRAIACYPHPLFDLVLEKSVPAKPEIVDGEKEG